MLRWFTKNHPYEKQKDIARNGDKKERLTLAGNTRTNREILYYLAENDPESVVRQAVAKNKSTPVHATKILSKDTNQDVRMELARRLVGLLPNVSENKHSDAYAFVVQSLGNLALDEVLKIRLSLSSTLKDHALAPPKVAAALAKDVERKVSEPILRFCTVLSDEDLIDILKNHPESWVVEAIAKRQTVTPDVSEAVIETRDSPGGKALIENDGAHISPDLLGRIIEYAKETSSWQKPAALHKNLSLSMAKEMASFVDDSVKDLLLARRDFDPEEVEDIARIFRRRVDLATDVYITQYSPSVRLRQTIEENRLDEDLLIDSLALGETEFLCKALEHLAGTDQETIDKIFSVQAPKSIVTLCWCAGLSMRFALQLQKEMGNIQPSDLLYPRGGTDYPLTEEELLWQAEFLGLTKAA